MTEPAASPDNVGIGTLRSILLLGVLLCLVGWPARAEADRVGRLVQILQKSRSYKVRMRVVITLSRIEDRRVAPALTKALSDRHHLVRALAARALAQIGAVEALPLIRRLARRDRHHYTRRMADRSARRLARKKKNRDRRKRGPRFFLRVGKLHNQSSAARRVVDRLRHALRAAFAEVPGVTTRLGPGVPTAEALRERHLDGYEVSGSIRRLNYSRSGPDITVRCSIRVELSTYPAKSMKAFYAGESTMEVTSRHTTRAQLDAFYGELLEGAARQARDHIVRSYLGSL